jgi:hypothetical protein
MRVVRLAAVGLATLAFASSVAPPPASAGIKSLACDAANAASKLVGKACDLVKNPGKAVKAGKDFATGHVGSAVKTVIGASSASTASTALGLAAIATWVADGAKFSLDETTKTLGEHTTPQLRTTWFSARYWSIAGIATLLTLPFLFAAVIQALIHSDLALLARVAIGYLPLAMLAIAVAAPVTMLLLAATDQLSSGLSTAGGGLHSSWTGAAVGSGLTAEPFLRFLVDLLTTACAIVLWIELAIREAAVYVIVLMLPLAFAALVWPARRVWAIRAVELLTALILAKLAIVAVFDLGAAALSQLGHGQGGGLTAGLAGTVLVLLAALSPWAVLRLVPMSELAHSAVGSLRAETDSPFRRRRGEDSSYAGRADDPPEAVSPAAADMDTSGVEGTLRRLEEGSDPLGRSRGDSQAGAQAGDTSGVADGQPLVATGDDGGGPAPVATGAAPTSGAGGTPWDDEGFEGWGPMYQAPNYSWKPLTLGSDGDVMNAKLWPPDDDAPPGEDATGPGDRTAPEDTPLAEDHEPRPPEQPNGDGPL